MSADADTQIDYFSDALVNRLTECSASISQQWNNPEGTTTRHFVLDDVLTKDDVNAIYNAFPKNGDGFFDRQSFREKKRTATDLSQYSPILSDITYAFQNPRVVDLITGLLELPGIEPDPDLYASGLSMMFQGDYLNPHIDNSHDAQRNRYRRLNLLFYVSPHWGLERGGNFELWDTTRTHPRTVVSHRNRLVVMETNKTSWHSVSKVIADQPRCCVSNYYFSEVSPDATDYFHVTSFLGRPEQPLRSLLGHFDNTLRNSVSKVLKIGRGKRLINKKQ
ncbi:conserved hypothetical protein [Luminiphilus syltensis NOR5-1B]|uniref:Prolyl 4-hydroxylase alpha subunit Fe(2+) 2OG dioxygenase domain-containing protein n=1 Tax=Luminiphilus syltensis NOR5-1B TaxID=565045 RepID=B8KXQ6_9GAMM|nr:2OG-Fe(II) oxygenase [Luminiphilus syltensis]EED36891.1 conserved hypothetical protein [Luminiphilus syltensis NOR5-1B]